jgi:hypothetical protein
LQYFSHYNDKLKGPTAASRELHADLLAGYYLCKKKGLVPQEVTPFQRTLMQGGTYNRSSTQFHGTPNQRGAAMDRGFMYAMDGKSLQEAARDGAEYVLRLLQ